METNNNKNNSMWTSSYNGFYRQLITRAVRTNYLLALFTIVLSSSVNAETFTVNISADEGEGSLRAVLTAAALSSETDNQIVFSEELQNSTIQLESALIYESTNSLSITGLAQLTIEAPMDDALLRVESDATLTIKLERLNLAEAANQTTLPNQDYLLDLDIAGGALHLQECLIQGHTEAFNKRGIIDIHVNGEESSFNLSILDTDINNGTYSNHLINATANNNLGLLKAAINNSHFGDLIVEENLINLVAERGTAQLIVATASTVQETVSEGALFSITGDIENSAVSENDQNSLTIKNIAIDNNTAGNLFSTSNNRGNTNTVLQDITIHGNVFQLAAETASKDHHIQISNVNFSDNQLNESGFNFNDDNLTGHLNTSQFNRNVVGPAPELATKKSILNFSAKSISNLSLDGLAVMDNQMAGIKFYNFNTQDTQLLNSTLANNDNSLPAAKQETNSLSGDNFGGGLFISAAGEATYQVTNTTISGNQAGVGGGLILLNKATLKLSSSTIANNSALEGAGLVSLNNYEASGEKAGSDFEITNSIVAGNSSASTNTPGDLWGEFTANYSLISELNSPVGFITKINGTPVQEITESTTNFLYQDPLLEALTNNGGNTLTHALNQNSPAIGAGNSTADLPTNDQRGDGFLRVSSARLDLGSIQFDGIVPDKPEPDTQEPPEDDSMDDTDAIEDEPQVDRSLGNRSSSGPSSGSIGWLLILILLPITVRNLGRNKVAKSYLALNQN